MVGAVGLVLGFGSWIATAASTVEITITQRICSCVVVWECLIKSRRHPSLPQLWRRMERHKTDEIRHVLSGIRERLADKQRRPSGSSHAPQAMAGKGSDPLSSRPPVSPFSAPATAAAMQVWSVGMAARLVLDVFSSYCVLRADTALLQQHAYWFVNPAACSYDS